MATNKTFTHAGVSRLKGEFKVRFASDAMRVKVLAKNGHSDIDIIQLKHPMNKADAINYLLEIDFATKDGVTNQEVHAALTEAAESYKEAAPAKAKKETKPDLSAIRARAKPAKKEAVKEAVEETEDAPF